MRNVCLILGEKWIQSYSAYGLNLHIRIQVWVCVWEGGGRGERCWTYIKRTWKKYNSVLTIPTVGYALLFSFLLMFSKFTIKFTTYSLFLAIYIYYFKINLKYRMMAYSKSLFQKDCQISAHTLSFKFRTFLCLSLLGKSWLKFNFKVEETQNLGRKSIYMSNKI